MSKRSGVIYKGIDKHGKEIWQLSFYPLPKAKRQYKTVRASSKREAEIERFRWIDSFQQTAPRPIGSKELSFDEIFKSFEIKCQADGDSVKTIKNYRSTYRNFFERFLKVKHPDIITMQGVKLRARFLIDQFKIWVVVDCKRENGWREELSKLKAIFSKLNAIELCDDEIVKTLRTFKKPKRHKRLYKELSQEQRAKLLRYIKTDRPDYYGAAYLIFRWGWRREQALTMKAANIKWEGLSIVALYCDPQDTKTKEPFIFRNIDPELANIIKGYYMTAKSRNSKWLFPNRNCNKHHSDHFTKYIRHISLKVLGIELRPHDFRHSFITEMKARGYSDSDIIVFTGHRDTKSLETYSHASSAKVKQIVEDTRLFDK